MQLPHYFEWDHFTPLSSAVEELRQEQEHNVCLEKEKITVAEV